MAIGIFNRQSEIGIRQSPGTPSSVLGPQSCIPVIAVDTSIAHLAGALRVPVWVAMSLSNDWRWLLDREDTPWHPTMRLFRQRDWGDWDEVIGRMTNALRELAGGKASSLQRAEI